MPIGAHAIWVLVLGVASANVPAARVRVEGPQQLAAAVRAGVARERPEVMFVAADEAADLEARIERRSEEKKESFRFTASAGGRVLEVRDLGAEPEAAVRLAVLLLVERVSELAAKRESGSSGSGSSGSGSSGSGSSDSGSAGSGSAGSGSSGSGSSGSGSAGPGTAGSGTAGPASTGTAGSGTAGAGGLGTAGTAGSGTAGTANSRTAGTAGSGSAGTAGAGTARAGAATAGEAAGVRPTNSIPLSTQTPVPAATSTTSAGPLRLEAGPSLFLWLKPLTARPALTAAATHPLGRWHLGARLVATAPWPTLHGDKLDAEVTLLAALAEARFALRPNPTAGGSGLAVWATASAGASYEHVAAHASSDLFVGTPATETSSTWGGLARLGLTLDLALTSQLALTLTGGIQLAAPGLTVVLPDAFQANRAPLERGPATPFLDLTLAGDPF